MACMDADLQHPPIVLKYMYKAMVSGADFCIPSGLFQVEMMADLTGTESSYREQHVR